MERSFADAMTQHPRRVLVVDDDLEIRVLLRALLEGSGYVVETARDGRQALASFPEPRPDLVVLDLAMPGIDGWGVLEALQGRGRLPPVLLLAEHGEDPRQGRFRETIAACLFKPVEPSEFLGTCRRVLDLAARTEHFLQERRRETRRPLVVEITLLSSEGSPVVRGTLVDISPGGFQLELGVSLEPGSPIRAALAVPGTAALTLEGHVRWRQTLPGGFLVGGNLDPVDPEKARILGALFAPPVPLGVV